MSRPETCSSYRVRVSLLFASDRPPVSLALGDAVTQALAELSLPVVDREGDGASWCILHSVGPKFTLTAGDAPVDRELQTRARRPDGLDLAETIPLLRLKAHRAHLTLEIEDHDAEHRERLSGPHLVALANRLVRRLLPTAPATLVLWHRTGALFTVEEFTSGPHRGNPTSAALTSPRRAHATLPSIVEDEPVHAPQLFETLDTRMTPANDVPQVPKPMTDGHERLRAIFRAVSPELPHDRGLSQAEDATLPSRLSVYVMNGTILVMSFPVGMGMLTYNLLKGEDMTATARVMALTGAAIGLFTFGPASLTGFLS